jgi:tetratricopeptide (TPR) repeat protein
MTGRKRKSQAAKPSIRSLLHRTFRRQTNVVLLLVAACLPIVLAAGPGEYLWTDIDEISGGALARRDLQDLGRAILQGVDLHYYRPTIFVLHTLDRLLFGDSPTAFRLTNAALHLVNVALTYLLLSRTTKQRFVSFAVAVLFGVHPLAITPVRWISDRTDLVVMGAILGFLLCVESLVRRPSRATATLALALLVLGLGAKETVAVTVLGTAIVFLVVEDRDARKRLVGLGVGQLVVVALWFLWRGHVSTNPVGVASDLTIVERVATAADVHLHYVEQLAIPMRLLVCDATRVPRPVELWFGAGVVLVLGTVVFTARLVRRGRVRPAIAIASVALLLLPTSGIVAIKHVRADRYLYCALPAVLYLAVTIVRRVSERRSSPRVAISPLLLGAVYITYALASAHRAQYFADNFSLWSHEIERNDACREGHSILAGDLLSRGHPQEALVHIDRALEPLARDELAYVNSAVSRHYRGLILSELGRLDDAALEFRALDSASSTLLRAEAAYQLGVIAFIKQDFLAAIDQMTTAERIGVRTSSRADLLLLRGYASCKAGRLSQCARDLQAVEASSESPLTAYKARFLEECKAILAGQAGGDSPPSR